MAAVTREYDYVIVGGGSAGCALASRLSSSGSVLLHCHCNTKQQP